MIPTDFAPALTPGAEYLHGHHGAAMTAGYEGIPGNSSYPPHRYSLEPDPVPSSYGRVLRGYYDVVRAYVAEILISCSIQF